MFSQYFKNTLLNFFSFFLIAFSLFIFIALVSYESSDPAFFNKSSSTTILNLGGPLGANISDFLFTIIGMGSYLILLIGCVWALQTIFFQDLYNSKIKIFVRFISSLILLISFCSILEYYFVNNAGGYLGKLIFTNLSGVLGFIGSLLFLVIFIIPASSLSFNFSWIEVLDFTGTTLLKTGNLALEVTTKIFQFLIINSKNITNSLIAFKEKEKIKKQEIVTQKNKDTLKNKQNDEQSFSNKVMSSEAKQPDLPNTTEPKLKEVEVSVPEKDDEKTKAVMPSTQLLDRALDDGSSLTKDELNQIASLLETKLEEFGIEATVESVLPGPVVTRFEIQPAPGTKASKITGIAQDIARSLSVSSVRVVEVIEGKSFVGIEIPNTNRKMVRLTEILSSQAFKNSPSNLTLALGLSLIHI